MRERERGRERERESGDEDEDENRIKSQRDATAYAWVERRGTAHRWAPSSWPPSVRTSTSRESQLRHNAQAAAAAAVDDG